MMLGPSSMKARPVQVESITDQDTSAALLRLTFERPILDETPLGVRVEVPACHARGPAGAPALPRRIVRVALPLGHRAAELEVRELECSALTHEPVIVMPIPPPAPATRPCVERPPPPTSAAAVPDPELYEREAREQRPTVTQ